MSPEILNYKYNPITNEFNETGYVPDVILPQVMWHITDRCPLSCPYCFATKTALETPVEDLPKVVRVMKSLGVQKVDIAGGEPMIYSYLPPAADLLTQSGIAITLTTSGASLPGNVEWLLGNTSRFSRIIFSIDGPVKEHDKLRGRHGAFDAVEGLIRQIKSREYDNIRINSVVVRPMLDEMYLERMIAGISNMAPKEWCLIQPHPANEKESFRDYSINDSEFQFVIDRVKQVALSSKTIGRILVRRISDYEGYWVLYPDSTLRRHTKTAIDWPSVAFSSDSLTDIANAVRENGIRLPMENAHE